MNVQALIGALTEKMGACMMYCGDLSAFAGVLYPLARLWEMYGDFGLQR